MDAVYLPNSQYQPRGWSTPPAVAATLDVIVEDEPSPCAANRRSLDRIPSFAGSDDSTTSCSNNSSPPLSVDEAVCKIARCRGFCEQIAATAAMHPTPVTATEVNLARLLQQAMQEIQQQLQVIQVDVSRVHVE